MHREGGVPKRLNVPFCFLLFDGDKLVYYYGLSKDAAFNILCLFTCMYMTIFAGCPYVFHFLLLQMSYIS